MLHLSIILLITTTVLYIISGFKRGYKGYEKLNSFFIN